ncbi:MAG: hypothetical protein HQL79_07500 [Magnetococcales bacterium]|nr:hypothetical protein [Magnetococcales bacterium]
MTVRQAIEKRIREQVTGFRLVAGSADLRSVVTGSVTPPAAYVFEVGRTAKANQLIRAVEQEITESYAVVIVVANYRDAKGSDGADSCRELCDQVAQALLGWQPAEASTSMEYAKGQLVDMHDNHFYWQDVYTTTSLIGSV